MTRRALMFRCGAAAGALALAGIIFILWTRPAAVPAPRRPHQELAPRAPAIGAGPLESRVKGLLIIRIVDEVEWPASSFESLFSPLRVGILGRTGVKDSLAKALEKPGSARRPVAIVEGDDPRDMGNCHVVFIPGGWRQDWDHVLSELTRPGVLTIGEEDGFLGAGGTMGFYLKDNRVRFALDRARGERSGLKFTAKLLELAGAP